MERPETDYALSGDVHVAFQVSGSGLVDLVWAPGTVSHLDLDWDLPPKARFIRRLGDFCRLIRFDKRGTGLSDRVTNAATLDERMDDIRAVMDAAGSKEAFVLGVSEGATLACVHAATHPARTRGLLLWGAQARWIQTADYPWGLTPEEAAADKVELRRHGVTREYITGESYAHVLGPVQDAWIEWLVRYFRAGASPAAVVALEEMNDELDVRNILASIKVPTLVMNAADDAMAHMDAARDLASRIPSARFVGFPGKHMFFLDEMVTEQVADEIEQFVTGIGGVPHVDRTLATVLFTDIVDSTQQLASLGDHAWWGRLASHHEIVRTELELHRGREVDTAGDGFFATFDGPGRAVTCAQSIIDRLRPLRIQIRAGVHTGEIETMAEKVGGIAVHIGARVAALAGPSEILVSSTVKDLTAGSGIVFEDAGMRELKGIPDRWHLYRVVSNPG